MRAKKIIDEAAARLLLSLSLRESSPRGDIIVITVPRSGLTWLCEIFESARRTRCVKEPLSPGDNPFFRGEYGIKPRRRYVGLAKEERSSLANFLRDVLAFRAMNWPRFRKFKLRTNLNVLVISKAPALAPWFEDSLGCRILYLTRHPLPNALSKIRNRWHENPAFGGLGWAELIDVYLENEPFAREYLDPQLVDMGWRIRHSGTDLERYVLNWCLDNVVPCREIASRPWLLVSYEELVLRPEESLRRIVKHFHLPNRDMARMKSALARPSRSTNMSETATVLSIRQGEADRLVSRWRTELADDDVARCFSIVEAFGVDLYAADSDVLNPKWDPFRQPGRPDLRERGHERPQGGPGSAEGS